MRCYGLRNAIRRRMAGMSRLLLKMAQGAAELRD